MLDQKKITKLNCKQIYSLWCTEPELISILDLRSQAEFKQFHIPGAISVKTDDLFFTLSQLGNKLGVIIANEEITSRLAVDLKEYINLVFVADISNWVNYGYPLAGSAIENIKNQWSQNTDVMSDKIILYHLDHPKFETTTYIIADPVSKEAAIIDSIFENVEHDLNLIKQSELRLRYVLATENDSGHFGAALEMRKKTQAKIALSINSAMTGIDISLEDGQILFLGDKKIHVISNYKKTNTSLSYYFEGRLFIGRSDCFASVDLQKDLSMKSQILKLPKETLVFSRQSDKVLMPSTILQEEQKRLIRESSRGFNNSTPIKNNSKNLKDG